MCILHLAPFLNSLIHSELSSAGSLGAPRNVVFWSPPFQKLHILFNFCDGDDGKIGENLVFSRFPNNS